VLGRRNDVIQADGPRGDREAEIVLAELQDPRTLLLSVGACHAEHNRASVNESAQTVTIPVVTDDPAAGADCADGLRVVLNEPLGARDLVDGSTGELVEVGEAPHR
jgi:hypothetical protein